ncbi:hypothetical protein C1H70_04540 [Halomonas urumqiensis]|uniref:Fungal lipase-type domain-containing protein n=2 Tax=Halomonas urumqiensis TaxID=1684789 RepID=A0A2N7UMN5_9GAMM|nr:hypothetical protein C1H70_04540 [Halomonas urumqiensis]PTB02306.1 hypothetical protein C6V82_11520 [Halomonas urumqiensis]
MGKILNLAYEQDWSKKSFSLHKAQVCAELSSIVYQDVQEYELKKASRIHLVASDLYRSFVRSGKTSSILDALNGVKLDARFFVVRGRYSLVFGTIFNDVVILAVRGTVFRKLWDWKANIDTEKFYLRGGRFEFFPFEFTATDLGRQYFHKGFFESIVPQFESISEQIKEKTNSVSNLKIVWTGHSLGGAMAAIGYAIHSSRNGHMLLADEMPNDAVCAYTFGMPRYCGLGVICGFSGPYHIYRHADVIPTVPLRRMGFSDSNREYELTESGGVAPTERTDAFGIANHIPKLLTSIKSHSIEGYAELIAKGTGKARP